jgi:hypothetical protein
MKQQPVRRYFHRGRPITEVEALDHRGLLRDGVTLSVPVSLCDAVTTKARVVDALGGTTGLHRPGARYDVLVRDRHRREAAAAYRAYDAEKATEWMGNPPTGAGSKGPIGQREGDICNLNGWPGRLRKDAKGNFYCDIFLVVTRPPHGSAQTAMAVGPTKMAKSAKPAAAPGRLTPP